ncbi:MAG TPA: rhodanese-like domain-containing protein [Myxococcota bacterium]
MKPAFGIGCGLALLGCAESVAREDLLARIQAGSPPPIVDVRSQSEFDESHLPGAVHIPFYALLSDRERIPTPAREAEPMVLYCEHGPRAGIARAQLWLAGVGPVVFLEGHMTAWKRDGLPVETSAGESGP